MYGARDASEICSMRVAQAVKRQRCTDTEDRAPSLGCGLASTAPSSAKLTTP